MNTANKLQLKRLKMSKTEQKIRVMACFTGLLWDGNETEERCRTIFKQYDGECIEEGTF